MRYKLQSVMRLFAKFGVLTKDEVRIGVGYGLKNRQANRYLARMLALGYIRRRHHPEKWIFAYEATEKLYRELSPEADVNLPPLRERDIVHRLACSHALLSLCKREFVSGVAMEHELRPQDLEKFCIERIPDGIVQVTQAGHPPFEMALEVETSEKSMERVEKILKNYEKTILGKRHYCQGLLLVVTPERGLDVYRKQLERGSPVFRGRVVLSRELDLSDVSESVLGRPLPSIQENPHDSGLSKRLPSPEGVKYLNHIRRYPRLKGTESRRQSADGLTVANRGISKPIG